ncbi:hypothetical protein TrRE_jg4655 [Triparma retinervis]|uniref:TLDc domain-containing protein n=1 Tax=Triparma retinervis TaxID=2557542 RepID=A0A9W7CJC1_9STRA|nr:hypothetical protein TrRE_jg4655 [Triparma retinervis]
MRLVLLDKNSDTYKEVCYDLKLGLQGHPASDIHIWQIDNPQANVAFDRRTANMLSLQCWTDCGALDSSNQMDDICRRGFVFPTNGAGMHFNHGNIKLDDSVESFMDEQTPEATSGSGKQQHFYIFSEVGVGRPYIIDSGAERRKPVGYDSLYLSKKVLDDDGDGVISAEEYEAIVGMEGKDPSSYEHEFVITDPTQVLPKYVVRFAADLDPDEDEEMSDPLKVYDRHDFFDPVLYRPVSLRDKMIGSHSMGEAANHKLVSMSDAYNAAKEDPIIAQKKKGIMDELNKIDDKMRAINLNFATVEERLYNILKESLATLKDEVNCKTKILLSTELEFRRQLEQLDNAEQWLERERTELSQTGFLEAWRQHTNMTSKMCSEVSAETSVLNNLEANLAIEGGVRIVTENGEPLMSTSGMPKVGGFDVVTNNNGTTELRQQLFADATAGATMTTGSTKKDLVSNLSADKVSAAAQATSVLNIAGTHSSASNPIPTISGMAYNPPNFLASGDGKMMDNDAWTQSLQKSMGVGGDGLSGLPGSPAPPPPAKMMGGGISGQTPALYTPQIQIPNPNLVPPNPVNMSKSYVPARQMAQVASHFSQFSLSALAERKMRQLSVAPNDQMVFRGSAIVGPTDAKKLYYSIPFISTLPTTSLCYSTRMHERSIKALQRSVLNVMAPTMVVIRSGEYIFGGYATDPWRFDGGRGGNPKGFLFSITLDCKIPYQGRQKDSQSGVLGGTSGRRHDCMWSGPDFMGFGIKDLCLRGDFRMCSSEIEHSYSVGCEVKSQEAKCFLAGSPIFVADEIEVWSIQN